MKEELMLGDLALGVVGKENAVCAFLQCSFKLRKTSLEIVLSCKRR